MPHWVSCTISGLGWKCAGIIDAILGVKSLGRQFRVSWAVLSNGSGARLGVELFGVGNVVLDKGRVEGGQENVLRWLRETFQLRDSVLQRVWETAYDGTRSASCRVGSGGWSLVGRWAGQAKHKSCGGILAGEWNFAVDGSGMVDDFSTVDF